MGLLNKTMLGTVEIYGSVILNKDNPSVTKKVHQLILVVMKAEQEKK